MVDKGNKRKKNYNSMNDRIIGKYIREVKLYCLIYENRITNAFIF